jgi:ABC-2 type transport system permease protein
VLLAVLAVFLQAIAGHKFIGWGLMVLYIVSTLTFVNLGFEHNLYNYGGVIDVPTSDINRLGKFWVGAWWLRLYWSAFAVGLVVLTYALWRRGTETRFWPRLRRLPSRLTGKAGLTFTVAAAVFIASGGFIYVNTNVWNDYRTQDRRREVAGRLREDSAVASRTRSSAEDHGNAKLEVDIRPQGSVASRPMASTVMENRTGRPDQASCMCASTAT